MKTYEGNLLHHFAGKARPEVDAIAHVCNCQGVMGSGVALAIKTTYPEAYWAYKNFEKANFGGLKLGSISRGIIRPGKEIYNLHAQMYYGTDGKRYLNYEALYECLEAMVDHLCFGGITTLAIPYNMGSDRAGGDWKVVQAMVEAAVKNTPIKPIAIKLP